jgi:IMP dehydrogenase
VAISIKLKKMPRLKFKEIDRAYGFDEIALVPGDVTVNPDQTNIDFTVRDFTLSIPVLASAMDAIVDTTFAIEFAKLGGLPVLNLEGVQTKVRKPR